MSGFTNHCLTNFLIKELVKLIEQNHFPDK